MAGFENDLMFALNADFTQADNQAPAESNGLVTNGQMWIGTTTANAGGTHINVGTITSPDASVTVGYSSPNITLQVAGGSGSGISTIAGDSGSITGANVTIFANNAANNAGATVEFVNSGTVSTLSVSDGVANCLIGRNAGNLTLSGIANTGVGQACLNGLTSGIQNTAMGNGALLSCTSGSFNSAFGYLSQQLITTGVRNTSTGWGSLLSCVTGSDNSAYGLSSLQFCTSSNNSAFGYQSLQFLTSGASNSAFGYNALALSTTASTNCAFGVQALQSNNGGANVGMGFQSMISSTSTSNTIALGYQTGFSLTGGTKNVLIGTLVANAMTVGLGNTIIGDEAGQAYTTSESDNILIGRAVTGNVGVSNETIIGTSAQTYCEIGGIAGVSVSNSASVVIDTTTGQLGTLPIPIETITITLTSSQIKNLNATPITIIPAQGAGKVITLVSAIGKFNYGGSNVFVAGAAQSVNMYYGTTNAATGGFISNGQITSSATNYTIYYTPVNLQNIPVANVENVAINAYNFVATEISGNAANDNTITITVKYFVASI